MKTWNLKKKVQKSLKIKKEYYHRETEQKK